MIKHVLIFFFSSIILTSCFPDTDDCVIYENNVELSFLELIDDNDINLIESGTYNSGQINLLLNGKSSGDVFSEDPVYKYVIALFEAGIDTVDSPRFEVVLNDSQSVFIDMVFSTILSECDTKLHAIESAKIDEEQLDVDIVNGFQVVGVLVNEQTITLTNQ